MHRLKRLSIGLYPGLHACLGLPEAVSENHPLISAPSQIAAAQKLEGRDALLCAQASKTGVKLHPPKEQLVSMHRHRPHPRTPTAVALLEGGQKMGSARLS